MLAQDERSDRPFDNDHFNDRAPAWSAAMTPGDARSQTKPVPGQPEDPFQKEWASLLAIYRSDPRNGRIPLKQQVPIPVDLTLEQLGKPLLEANPFDIDLHNGDVQFSESESERPKIQFKEGRSPTNMISWLRYLAFIQQECQQLLDLVSQIPATVRQGSETERSEFEARRKKAVELVTAYRKLVDITYIDIKRNIHEEMGKKRMGSSQPSQYCDLRHPYSLYDLKSIITQYDIVIAHGLKIHMVFDAYRAMYEP